MARPHRYTGCWPPLGVLSEYPNWVLAIDEETEPGQDETTIKPEPQQAFISKETDYSAAIVHFANGSTASGVLGFINGKIESVNVFNGQDWWTLQGEFNQTRWKPLVETWLPPEQRRPSVSLSDKDLFPAQVRSRLGYPSGEPIAFTIPLAPDAATPVRKSWFRFW